MILLSDYSVRRGTHQNLSTISELSTTAITKHIRAHKGERARDTIKRQLWETTCIVTILCQTKRCFKDRILSNRWDSYTRYAHVVKWCLLLKYYKSKSIIHTTNMCILHVTKHIKLHQDWHTDNTSIVKPNEVVSEPLLHIHQRKIVNAPKWEYVIIDSRHMKIF